MFLFFFSFSLFFFFFFFFSFFFFFFFFNSDLSECSAPKGTHSGIYDGWGCWVGTMQVVTLFMMTSSLPVLDH